MNNRGDVDAAMLWQHGDERGISAVRSRADGYATPVTMVDIPSLAKGEDALRATTFMVAEASDGRLIAVARMSRESEHEIGGFSMVRWDGSAPAAVMPILLNDSLMRTVTGNWTLGMHAFTALHLEGDSAFYIITEEQQRYTVSSTDGKGSKEYAYCGPKVVLKFDSSGKWMWGARAYYGLFKEEWRIRLRRRMTKTRKCIPAKTWGNRS